MAVRKASENNWPGVDSQMMEWTLCVDTEGDSCVLQHNTRNMDPQVTHNCGHANKIKGVCFK